MQTRKLTEVPSSEFSKETNFIVEINEVLKRVPSSEIRQLVTDEKDRAQEAERVLADSLDAETTRAVRAENILTENLTAETTRAKAEEKILTDNLTLESSRAAAAEKTLTDNLLAETARAKVEEKANADAVADESARAKAAEKVNADAVSAEVTRAKAAEKSNTDALSAEVTRASAREDGIAADLSGESTRAINAESALAEDISVEVMRAKTKESELQGSIQSENTRAQEAEKGLTDDLSAETTRAKAAEKVLADNLSAEAARAKAAEKVNTDSITAEVTRSKAAEKTLTDNLSAEVTRATAAETSIQNTITTNKPKWDDKYTKNEVDNKFATLETAIDWKEAVNTFTDLATIYPKPDDGWTVNVKDTDYTYRWSGTTWIAISANAIPKATQAVDGLLSKEDKTAYDDANNKKHTHGNKAVIDKLTQALLDSWNGAYTHISDVVKHITAAERTNWADAYNKRHEHSNKVLLDGLTQALLDNWNTVSNKVDKVAGKGLSTNDYTSAEKDKLAKIAGGAEVNVQADWNITDTAADAYIKNKPSSFTPASHTHTKSQITDMPTKLSQFTNDPGYITQSDVDISQNHTHSNKTILDKITQALLDNWAAAYTHVNDMIVHITAAERGNWNSAFTHVGNKSNPHGVTKAQVGLGNVPNVVTNDLVPTYAQAVNLQNLVSGEKLSISMGKIMRLITEFTAHKANTANHIVSAERIAWNQVYEMVGYGLFQIAITFGSGFANKAFTVTGGGFTHNGTSPAGGVLTVTVPKSNTTYTITCLGNARTVTTANYFGVYAVTFEAISASFGNNTWAQIAAVAEAGNAASYWSIGAEKKIMLTDGQPLTLCIYGFNHDYKVSGGKAGITLGLKDLMGLPRAINNSNANAGGFTGSAIYTWLQNDLYNSIPTDLRTIIKPVYKKTSDGKDNAFINTDAMKIFLFSEAECFSTTVHSYAGEGSQYPIFTDDKSRQKEKVSSYGNTDYWWERSPYRGSSTDFCCVNYQGIAVTRSADISSGVCFGVCI